MLVFHLFSYLGWGITPISSIPLFSLHFWRYKQWLPIEYHMMASSNGNIFHITGPLWGEFTSHWWIPHTKASDAELWCFLWSASEQIFWVNSQDAGDLRCRNDIHMWYILQQFSYSDTVQYKWDSNDLRCTFVESDISCLKYLTNEALATPTPGQKDQSKMLWKVRPKTSQVFMTLYHLISYQSYYFSSSGIILFHLNVKALHILSCKWHIT